ncbi:matrixin family metalloprotease [Adhaeretor mobilis]|uniref:Matrixin n=1 Tax=Adhaeretor mobilis TaxID=1930276 RepID=A0A517MPJ1_9BACT|nr:matrixin family metalloprotease [Adhaeretor mobilis]QDS96800.1 Matrixin [Adhaeretor mobilis]
MRTLLVGFFSMALWLLLVHASSAYNVFGPYPWGEEDEYYLKWGAIFAPGSPGGTITWSLMPDGTTIDPSFTDPNITGTSDLSSILNGLGQSAALATIEQVFDKWSSAANIYFEHVSDSGEPFAGIDAQPSNTGHIRIGAFEIAGSAGGVGYAPPPNGGSLEGDVLLNSNNTFFFDPGEEGDPIQIFNDFESLLLHEVGHALGLAHSDVCSVMSAHFDCFQFVNRELDPDDIAGIQFLYGPALQADFDHNNLVDVSDLGLWQTGYGAATGAMDQDGDANGDGAVTGKDLLIWQGESGVLSSTALKGVLAVPEPARLIGHLGWMICFALTRRRQAVYRFSRLA